MADNVAILSPKGRVSFPHVFKPHAFQEGQEPKYDVTLIFPAGTDLSPLKDAATAAAREKWGKKIPPKVQVSTGMGGGSPFRDCSEKSNLVGYEDDGSIFVKFSSKFPPGVIDQGKRPISEDSGSFYAGCWAHVACRAYAYENPKKCGINFELVNIQKTGDGEEFGGGGGSTESAQAMFDEIEGADIEAPADFLS